MKLKIGMENIKHHNKSYEEIIEIPNNSKPDDIYEMFKAWLNDNLYIYEDSIELPCGDDPAYYDLIIERTGAYYEIIN